MPSGLTVSSLLLSEQKVDNRPVTERIKTFEDAMEALGQGNHLVEEYIAVRDKLRTDAGELIAYLKLRIIVAALNEGWEPKFTKDEYRYFPWFYFYTKEEYESYKTKVETNELISVPNTQDFRDLQASYNKLAEEHEKLEKWYSRPSKRYLLRKVFKVFDVKSKEQLAEVLNIKEIKL